MEKMSSKIGTEFNRNDKTVS